MYVPIRGDEMIKFIHTADLHLDSPFKGLTHVPNQLLKNIQESSFKAFENLVYMAIDREVDFIVIAGDLFDLNTRSIRAQIFLKKQFERLEAYNIFVYAIYGNHDYVKDDRLYLQFPKNVYIFKDEVETTLHKSESNETVSLTGFSYHTQHVKKNIMRNYPTRSDQSDYHIGIYHGDTLQQSSQYAPFEMKDLQKLHYDYVALGHIHQNGKPFENVPAYYSGSIQGRHINEEGNKGAYYVEIDGPNHSTEFLKTSVIDWHRITVSIDNTDSINTIVDQLVEKLPITSKTLIIRLILKVNGHDAVDISEVVTTETLNQLLTDYSVWILDVDTVLNSTESLSDLYPDSLQQAKHDIAHSKIDSYLNELTKQVPPALLKEFKLEDNRHSIIKKALNKIATKD